MKRTSNLMSVGEVGCTVFNRPTTGKDKVQLSFVFKYSHFPVKQKSLEVINDFIFLTAGGGVNE